MINDQLDSPNVQYNSSSRRIDSCRSPLNGVCLDCSIKDYRCPTIHLSTQWVIVDVVVVVVVVVAVVHIWNVCLTFCETIQITIGHHFFSIWRIMSLPSFSIYKMMSKLANSNVTNDAWLQLTADDVMEWGDNLPIVSAWFLPLANITESTDRSLRIYIHCTSEIILSQMLIT